MKLIHRIFLLLGSSLILLGSSHVSQAQTAVSTIPRLAIDLWPDYDAPELLVLLTGTLDPTELPATVTIPLPSGARLNAVARITDEGIMTDDIEYTALVDSVSFTTPNSFFRVEYYLPFTTANSQRQFTFTWIADVNVTQLDLTVQQPLAAASLQTEPVAISSQTGGDGLTYHTLPTQTVPAGQPFAVTVQYPNPTQQLSVNAPVTGGQSSTVTETAVTTDPPFNWPLLLAIVGGTLMVVAVGWQIMANGRSARPRKPTPKRSHASTAAPSPPRTVGKFCHNCGQQTRPGDKFCRNCGTKLRTKS